MYRLFFTKSLLIGIILLFIGVENSFATDYYQRQSGNWNSSGTWTTDITTWNPTINNGTYPKVGDNVYLKNNGNQATITLTADAECSNLIFDGSEPASVIAMGNYNLTVSGNWTTNWSSNATISQGGGYLQINGGIPQFHTAKTIANLRIGSGSFSFVQSNTTTLTVTSSYDYNCFQSTIPTGIDASSATKIHRTPCNPILTVSTLTAFGSVCTGSSTPPNSFNITGAALNNSNITIGALTGYTYSTTANGVYSNSLSLSQPGDSLKQTIFVKFNPAISGSHDGNIVVGGGGATAVNVVASGSGSSSVVPSVGSLTATNITSASVTLGATISIAGCAEVVTERGFYYSTTNGFADGAGTKVSENGSFGTGFFSINTTGLSASTTYYYKAFATNSNGTTYTTQGTFNNIPRTYYSRQSGNWTSPTTWTTEGCWQTLNTGTYPKACDNVVICNENQVTVNETGLACNNLNMDNYLGSILLNNDLRVYGNTILTNHNYISVGIHTLSIDGNYTNTPNGYNARIDYSSGNIIIGGNVTVDKNGTEPFNSTGNGWVILTGTSKTITTNTNIIIPNLKQPTTGFSTSGTGIITISNTFNQNLGFDAPVNISISNPSNVQNIPIKYFKSTATGNWNNTSTWQQSYDEGNSWVVATSTPSGSDGLVTIQNGHTVTLSNNVIANSVTVNSGGTLSVGAGKQFTVNSSLTNNGTLQLLSSASGTATLLSQGTISGTGTYKVQQYFTSIRNWYISTPLANATAPAGFSYFKYDEPGNNIGFSAPSTAYWENVAVGSTMNSMVGYVTQPTTNPSTIEFSGTTLNNGNKSITLTRTAGKTKEGFNLIGNPYPSYVNWTDAIKTNIDQTIWYRTKNNGGTFVFDTFNGIGTNNNQQGAVCGFVPPMQSVWVRVSAGQTSGTLQFTNALRSHESGTNRLKAPSKTLSENKILRLQVSNGTNSDEAIVLFNPNASNGFDDYDSPKMSNANVAIPEIYTVAEDENLVINGLTGFTADKVIPLGFTTGEANNFSIKATEISNLGAETRIILKDNLQHSEHDLTSGVAYNFKSDATYGTDRFSILFKSATTVSKTDNPTSNTNIGVYANANNQITVSIANNIIGQASIYNTTGQKMDSKTITAKTTLFHNAYPAGVYLVQVSVNGKNAIRKVVIK